MSAAELPGANGSAKNHANGKPRAKRGRGAARKGPSVNCGGRLPCGESKPQLTPDPVEAALPVEAELSVPREQVCSRLGEDAAPAKKSRKRRAWQPEARDHFIYAMVKFEGLTQQEAADRQRLSQATVSRVIQRYERWQAHADPREGGRLDPAERLRAQRWLTYERNELILGSALRIARAVEGTTELWKTVRTQPGDVYRTDKASVRDETTAIDRTGVAARFLRLAFKVNMEQLALVEKDPPPLPEALNEEEIAAEERQDAAVAEDFRRVDELLAGTKPGAAQEPPVAATGSEGKAESDAAREPVTTDKVLSTEYSVLGNPHAGGHAGVGRDFPPAASSLPGAAPLNLHNLHDGPGEKSSASANPPCTCAADALAEKNVADACISQPGNCSTGSDQAETASTIRSFPAPASVATLPAVTAGGTRDKEVAG